jgi:hypothetical protein
MVFVDTVDVTLCYMMNYIALFSPVVRPSLFGLLLIITSFRFIYCRCKCCIFQAMRSYQVKNPYLPKLAVNT